MRNWQNQTKRKCLDSWHNLRRPHQLTKTPLSLVGSWLSCFPKPFVLRPSASPWAWARGCSPAGPIFRVGCSRREIQRFFGLPWIRLKSEMRFDRRQTFALQGRRSQEGSSDSNHGSRACGSFPKPCNQPATPGKSSKPLKHSTGNNEKSSIVTARLRTVGNR